MNDAYLRTIEKRNKIPSLIITGITLAVITQFSTDLILYLLFFNSNNLERDLSLVEIPAYYATISSAIIIATVAQFMDRFATVALGIFTFTYVFDLVNNQISDNILSIDLNEMMMDVLAGIILVFIFDPKATLDYYNHRNDKHNHPSNYNAKRTLKDIILITFVVNLYSIGTDLHTNEDSNNIAPAVIDTD